MKEYYCVLLFTCFLKNFSVNTEETSSLRSFYRQGTATEIKSPDGRVSYVINFHGQDSAQAHVDDLLGCGVANDMRCVVKKIPYATEKETGVLPVRYSACFRCGVCVAVAKELNSLFTHIQDAIEYLPRKENSECELHPDMLTLVLNATCHHTFKRYGIRTNGQQGRSLSPATYKIQTTRLRTTFDDKWPEKLREACLLYLRHYGHQALYQSWLRSGAQDKSTEMIQRLCRSEGVFRDCSSVPLESLSGKKNGRNLKSCAN